MSRVMVRFPSSTVRTTNAALDVEASALRYRDALEAALAAALPAHVVTVAIDETARALSVEVESDDETLVRTIERDVLDHAWVVRQMGSWAVV
jgi:acyl-CoA hydrolase